MDLVISSLLNADVWIRTDDNSVCVESIGIIFFLIFHVFRMPLLRFCFSKPVLTMLMWAYFIQAFK